MSTHAKHSLIFAACLAAVACTDEQASTAVVAPAGPENAPAATAEAGPAPALAAMTSSIEGLNESPLCALDTVNGVLASEGTFTVSASQPIIFEGWVAMTNLQSPGSFRIVLDGQSDFEIGHVTGVARDDVADAYSSDALKSAGFKTELPALEVPADRYSVMLSHDEAGSPIVCRTNLSLAVSQ